ncbi:unnamed protein product [Polarella glacialis]|nr:unnamed protein product [Polarella glacialis]
MWGAWAPWQRRYEMAACWAEQDGLESKDVEGEARHRLVAPSYAAAQLSTAQLSERKAQLLEEWRKMERGVYVAALRGCALSELPADDELRSLQVPVLILAAHGDAEHPVEAAEDLAALIPRSTLVVARNLEEAQQSWSSHIRSALG